MASDDDRFEPKPAGRFAARIAGKDYNLRRPTIGETRRWVEVLEQVNEERKAALAEAGADYDRTDFEAALVDWWREVFATLDTKGDGELPDEIGDLPPWMLAVDLIAEARAHWSAVPWGPGGSPTQRQAAQAAKASEATTRLLDAAARLPALPT